MRLSQKRDLRSQNQTGQTICSGKAATARNSIALQSALQSRIVDLKWGGQE